MPAAGVTLFRVRGIRVAVDFSWFIVLFLIIIWLSASYRDQLGVDSGDSEPYLLAVASALLFFASILLHELGHACGAIRHGIGVSGITLWMFGGVSRLERDSDTPGTEFKIGIAGPLVTAAIVVVCGAASCCSRTPTSSGTPRSPEATRRVRHRGDDRLARQHQPAGPGLQPRPGLPARRRASREGDRLVADRQPKFGDPFAATLGEWFGLFLILAGLGYFLVYLGDVIGGIWLAFVGFILRGAAKSAIAQTEFTSRIEGISVADVMDPDPVAIPEGASIEQALDEYFLRYRSPWFPVVDTARHVIGLVDRPTADNVPAVERTSASVRDVVARDGGSLTVMEDAPLESVLGNETLRRLGALIATDADGHISGMLTIDAIGRALQPSTPARPRR